MENTCFSPTVIKKPKICILLATRSRMFSDVVKILLKQAGRDVGRPVFVEERFGSAESIVARCLDDVRPAPSAVIVDSSFGEGRCFYAAEELFDATPDIPAIVRLERGFFDVFTISSTPRNVLHVIDDATGVGELYCMIREAISSSSPHHRTTHAEESQISLTKRLLSAKRAATGSVSAELFRDSAGISVLSPAESRVLKRMAEGLDGKELAESLCISIHTLKQHIASIRRKTGIKSKSRLIAVAAYCMFSLSVFESAEDEQTHPKRHS